MSVEVENDGEIAQLGSTHAAEELAAHWISLQRAVRDISPVAGLPAAALQLTVSGERSLDDILYRSFRATFPRLALDVTEPLTRERLHNRMTSQK